ncbi:hypothetical protein CKF54_03705 [Psittacicella hinzii]|uniref:Uncharacterized protein n=1 Tax=Psittacicella hinzii TaxID=2028575 RepID=A0A3A1Y9X4_9GAMM|nr:hypothetical protein [Psittacicella hinzii]RIY32917.1 hypothetical protein CKF54_03705 [Psittacicella hinzii]
MQNIYLFTKHLPPPRAYKNFFWDLVYSHKDLGTYIFEEEDYPLELAMYICIDLFDFLSKNLVLTLNSIGELYFKSSYCYHSFEDDITGIEVSLPCVLNLEEVNGKCKIVIHKEATVS